MGKNCTFISLVFLSIHDFEQNANHLELIEMAASNSLPAYKFIRTDTWIQLPRLSLYPSVWSAPHFTED